MQSHRYKTFVQRLGALLVDGIVFGSFFFFLERIADTSFTWYFPGQVLGILYRIFSHWKLGQTIGKWVLNIKVVDNANEENNPSLYNSLLRESPSIVVLLFDFVPIDNVAEIITTGFLIAELICIWKNNKQRSIHDLIAGTVVIDIKQYSEWENRYYFNNKK